jgi:hypothetical protein
VALPSVRSPVSSIASTLLMGGAVRVGLEQRNPLLVNRLVVPGRLGQEPLQPLDLAMLGTGGRLGVGQGGQGLVAISRQQQPLQGVTQTTTLPTPASCGSNCLA